MIYARVEKSKTHYISHFCEKLCYNAIYVKNCDFDKYASAIYYCDFLQFLTRKPHLLMVFGLKIAIFHIKIEIF